MDIMDYFVFVNYHIVCIFENKTFIALAKIRVFCYILTAIYFCVQSQMGHALAQGHEIKGSPNLQAAPKIPVHKK